MNFEFAIIFVLIIILIGLFSSIFVYYKKEKALIVFFLTMIMCVIIVIMISVLLNAALDKQEREIVLGTAIPVDELEEEFDDEEIELIRRRIG